MTWNFPVHGATTPTDLPEGATVAQAVPRALDRDAAFKFISGEDRRPLLILRECTTCNGTDDALLNDAGSNEKTFILSKWFRCVKLPTTVLAEDHAFHALFEGEDPPHLFLARWDGSEPIALTGDRAQGELWKAMIKTLRHDYKRDPEKAVRDVQKLYAQLDRLDTQEDLTQAKLDRALESGDERSSKARKLRKELEKIGADKQKLLDQEKKLMDLGLVVKKPKGSKESDTR